MLSGCLTHICLSICFLIMCACVCYLYCNINNLYCGYIVNTARESYMGRGKRYI